MTRYVLDTNLYIEAARDRDRAEELKSFSSAFSPYLYLHAVVAQELLAGAVSAALERQVERGILGPYERRGRLVLPSYRAWRRSGEIIAALIRAKKLSLTGVRPSLLNDALLAASCRERGMVLITRNTADFQAIRRIEPVRFVEPWPVPA